MRETLQSSGLILGALVFSSFAFCEDIVDQRDFTDSINACAPASILNALKFSDPEYQSVFESLLGSEHEVKMRFLVDRYFRPRESIVYPAAKRWGMHGVASEDLALGLNELLNDHDLGALAGEYLDRVPDEPSLEFVRRIQSQLKTSISRGFRPILSLRSFYVRRREENGNEPGWETGPHHNVVVMEVGELETGSGFLLKALDPWEGREITIFLYREGGQSFRALKGTLANGKWLKGTPFLVASAPEAFTLQPRQIEWHQRWIVVANYLIGDFD